MPTIELFAVQPYMRLTDYLDAEAFYAKMETLFVKAESLRVDRRSAALIAFPEELATFLALVGRQEFIRGASTIDEAYTRVGKVLWPQLARTMWSQRTLSLRRAFFHLTAKDPWRIWHTTMADLARRFSMTVAAGTALLPENRLGYATEAFSPASAHVYNLAMMLDPSGAPLSITRKVNLVPGQEDRLGLAAAPVESALDVVALPTRPDVTLATAICYDAFAVAHTDHEPGFHGLLPDLDQKGVHILIQPSANPWPWDQPWPLDHERPPRLRKEQWCQESLPTALVPLRSVAVAVNPQLLFCGLSLHFDGQSAIWVRGTQGIEALAVAPSFRAESDSECVVHAQWNP